MKKNNFKYVNFNANPKNKKTEDCVIRAISKGLNQKWEDTYLEMAKFCIKKGYMLNGKNGYKTYLKSKGYEMCKMPRREDRTRYTIKEFVEEIAEPNKTYIIKVANHLTLVQNGVLYDTWDCSKKSVGNYWVV